MSMYKERRLRTVNLKLDQSTSYRRADVLAAVEESIGRRQVEAIGQLQRNSLWEVVLKDVPSKQALMRSAIVVKGVVAESSDLQGTTRKLRMIHVPTCIPNEYLVDKLWGKGVRVLQLANEIDKHDGLLTNVRIGVIDGRDAETTPDVLLWSFDGLPGKGLALRARSSAKMSSLRRPFSQSGRMHGTPIVRQCNDGNGGGVRQAGSAGDNGVNGGTAGE